MYERTDQHKLADELLEKMIKKFKHSCKVFMDFYSFIFFFFNFEFLYVQCLSCWMVPLGLVTVGTEDFEASTRRSSVFGTTCIIKSSPPQAY